MPQPLVEVLRYALPDAELLRSGCDRTLVWRVDQPSVVVGQGNRVLDSLRLDAIARDGIRVYRRPSGGQPVYLSPRTLQLTVLLKEHGLTSPLLYFHEINKLLIQTLGRLLGMRLQMRGTSDLATEDERKVFGSSIYRGRGRIFYHGVLNVSEKPETVGRYLLHPPKEPDYREGRDHLSFIASLAEFFPGVDETDLLDQLEKSLSAAFVNGLPDLAVKRSAG